jgi:hypothetical protein
MEQLCEIIECQNLRAKFLSELFDILNFVWNIFQKLGAYAPGCRNAAAHRICLKFKQKNKFEFI